MIPLRTDSLQSWRTPVWLFERLRERFDFQIDAAADYENALLPLYYDEKLNGLEQPWVSWTFCNPPYKNILPWVKKAIEEAKRGNASVLLVPARFETEWFRQGHPYAYVEYIYPRVAFVGPKDQPPHASCLMIFSAASVISPRPVDKPLVNLVEYRKPKPARKARAPKKAA